MRWLTIVVVLAALPALLPAQTAAPNAAGISLGHIHLTVPDPAATQKIWAEVFGGEPMTAGPLTMVKLPGIFIIITRNEKPSGGTNGSTVNHVGFVVKDYPGFKAKAMAAGLGWQELTPNVQAFLSMPDDVRVEIMEDKTIATAVAFHHIHESVLDQKATQEWYLKTFGAESGTRRNAPTAVIPGGEVDYLSAAGRGGKAPAAAPAPTKGRSLDHIGFEVKDLDAFAKKLEAEGIKLDVPVRDMTKQFGLKIAFLTDPNGTYIELTQGLSAK